MDEAESNILEESRTVTLQTLGQELAPAMNLSPTAMRRILRNIVDTMLICLERKKAVGIRELGQFRLVVRRKEVSRRFTFIESESVPTSPKSLRVALEWEPTQDVLTLRKGLMQWQRVDEPRGNWGVVQTPIESWTYPPRGIPGEPVKVWQNGTLPMKRKRRREVSMKGFD